MSRPGLSDVRGSAGFFAADKCGVINMGDFARPKIVWGEISDRSKFAYDSEGRFVPEATTFLMTGSDLPYLLCVLNNPASEWFFSKLGTTTGVGTVRWKKFTIEQLPIPSVDDGTKDKICSLFKCLLAESITCDDFAKATNALIYKAMHLDADEVDFVEAFAQRMRGAMAANGGNV